MAWDVDNFTRFKFIDSTDSNTIFFSFINTSNSALSVFGNREFDPVFFFFNLSNFCVFNLVSNNWSATIEHWFCPCDSQTLTSGSRNSGRVDFSRWINRILHKNKWSGFGWFTNASIIFSHYTEFILDVSSESSYAYTRLS